LAEWLFTKFGSTSADHYRASAVEEMQAHGSPAFPQSFPEARAKSEMIVVAIVIPIVVVASPDDHMIMVTIVVVVAKAIENAAEAEVVSIVMIAVLFDDYPILSADRRTELRRQAENAERS
jgi:hypothetical protein